MWSILNSYAALKYVLGLDISAMTQTCQSSHDPEHFIGCKHATGSKPKANSRAKCIKIATAHCQSNACWLSLKAVHTNLSNRHALMQKQVSKMHQPHIQHYQHPRQALMLCHLPMVMYCSPISSSSSTLDSSHLRAQIRACSASASRPVCSASKAR